MQIEGAEMVVSVDWNSEEASQNHGTCVRSSIIHLSL
jgi:hypothetical protein